MKNLILAIVATAVAIAFSSCVKDPNGPQPRVGVSVSVGVNSNGQVGLQVYLTFGNAYGYPFGYYYGGPIMGYPTTTNGYRVAVLYVRSVPGDQNHVACFDQNGNLMCTADCFVFSKTGGLYKDLQDHDYPTKGQVAVLVRFDALSTAGNVLGAHIIA